jgi:long-subunit fatty acid transport protein
MKRQVTHWFWLGLISFTTCCTAPARADGVRRDGVGAASIGRGGTNVAFSDNGVILLDNPAGMVNVPGRGLFEFGIDGLLTDLHYSDPENDRRPNRHNPMALPQLSYIRTSEDGRWAIGLGMFAPAGFGAQWDLNSPALGGGHHYKSFGALLKILPGVAYRVTDKLSVGGTFGVAVSHAELEGPFFGQTGGLRGVPTLLDLQATGATTCWSLGLQYQLNDRTTLGLAYLHETRFRLDGNARVSVLGVAPVPLESAFNVDASLVWPRSLAGGISHTFGETCRHRASAEVIWFDWSGAFQRVDLTFSESTNPVFPALLGPTFHDRIPLDWSDSVSVRLGYEFLLTECDTLRCGYIYHPQPIPSETLTPYIPAILEHAVSVGYGRRSGSWDFNIAYQYSFGPDQSVSQSGIVGGDFDRSRIEADVHWLALSLGYRF